jgi:hypothetical protein
MLWGFAAKQANKYAADLSVWVREGKEQQRERGEWLGGPIPDGYLGVKVPRGDDPRKTRVELRLDPEREPVTCRLWALARDGHAPAPLARILNSAGLRTRAGRAWTRRRVQDTLENAVYAGPPRSGVAARLPRPTETRPRAILPLRPWIASPEATRYSRQCGSPNPSPGATRLRPPPGALLEHGELQAFG